MKRGPEDVEIGADTTSVVSSRAVVKRLRGGGDDADPMEDYFPEPGDEDLEEEIVIPEEIDSQNADFNDQSVFVGISENMRQRWTRPANKIQDNSEDVSIQWLDMDLIGGEALPQHPNELVSDRRRAVGSSTGQVPIIRAFGATEHGNSAAIFIHGFTPYGFFALPENATFDNTEENLAKIREIINNRLEGAARGTKFSEYCRAVSYITSHKSIMGYDTPHTSFFKVMVAMPNLIPTLKRIMEDGIDLAGVTVQGDNQYSAFECNVPFVLRYMIDQDISGAGWLTMPARTYQLREASRKQTHCQVRRTLV